MPAPRAGRCLVCGALLGLLAGCGGGDGDSAERPDLSLSPTLPSATRTVPSPTRTVPSPTRTLQSPTRTDEATSEQPTDETSVEPTTGPTEPPQETDSDVPVQSPSRTERPTKTVAPSPTDVTSATAPATSATSAATRAPSSPGSGSATESSGPTDESAAGDDAEESDEGTPAWVWWLLAGLLVAAPLVAWLVVARARGRRARQEEMEAAEAEVAWLARVLLPQLTSTGSLDQAVGGWQVALPRVAAAEDRLTALATDAKDPADRERARALRDAVRDSRARVETLTRGGTPESWALDLQDAIAGLESALAHDEERP